MKDPHVAGLFIATEARGAMVSLSEARDPKNPASRGGIYAAILTPGIIKVGDRIVVGGT